jgi:hypothetical protein
LGKNRREGSDRSDHYERRKQRRAAFPARGDDPAGCHHSTAMQRPLQLDMQGMATPGAHPEIQPMSQ